MSGVALGWLVEVQDNLCWACGNWSYNCGKVTDEDSANRFHRPREKLELRSKNPQRVDGGTWIRSHGDARPDDHQWPSSESITLTVHGPSCGCPECILAVAHPHGPLAYIMDIEGINSMSLHLTFHCPRGRPDYQSELGGAASRRQ